MRYVYLENKLFSIYFTLYKKDKHHVMFVFFDLYCVLDNYSHYPDIEMKCLDLFKDSVWVCFA